MNEEKELLTNNLKQIIEQLTKENSDLKQKLKSALSSSESSST